ncbi:Phospholipid:diacylglycerol acyltransferase (PDAT) (Pombe LRO1 homolog 1) (Triacylglycerol synthase) (TAG synthase) [Durusdinium trenchii]|uniref:Phospholipid:diacylglycerol acyltransferase (PDAT) (Pombe LRO1 homolog 1) (Triacylglycerol synthase) (TAG synthase) n=1 Tax=Durusdinium trenchii TaxID=1381693 RepID=A0ABP0RBR0_9DINO
MGQQASTENQDLEDGVKTVVLIHGLASCALRGIGVEGAAGFLCDNCRSGNVSRLVYVSISELAKRPYIVKGLGLAWEPAVSKDGVETMNTSHGYHNILVNPVEGLDGIKSLNPGAESNLAPILLWQTVIDSLSDFNLLAINYDWRRWGDLIYIEQLVEKFQNQVQMAVRISRQPTVMIAHSLGAQVITYMMGVLGAAWTQAHISDVILVGPATMGSPSVFAAYANGPSTITHSSVVPVASFLEQRLRDVASTWPGLLSVMPTALDGLDTFGGLLMAESPQKTYGGMSSVEFLEDLAACEDDEAFDENTLHERARKWMEKHLVLNAHRAWRKEFQNAAVMRKGFELHVSPNLRPPSCRVHVIYSDGIDTPSRMKFQRNLYHKCQIVGFEKGDDTLTAKSVEQMCAAWTNAGVPLSKHNAGHVHHKELISCPFTLNVVRDVMAKYLDSQSESESEDGWCAAY